MKLPLHVLSTINLNEAQLARLKDVSPDISLEQVNRPEDSVQASQVSVLLSNGLNINLEALPALQWVQIESAGVNHLHATPLWHSPVTITSANGVHSVQISEYIMQMLLALGHHLPTVLRLQNQATWAGENLQASFKPYELRGQTLGIVGYGAIGRETARLAKAFGMRVLATRRDGPAAKYEGWTITGTGDPDGTLPDEYYDMSNLPDLLAASDAVVLTLPLTGATRHLIGEVELAVMQPHSILINISRGALLDQAALATALQSGRLRAAALDVTDPEPLPAADPLWKMENVIITPHISGKSRHYYDRLVELCRENLLRYLKGEPLLNVVRRALGY